MNIKFNYSDLNEVSGVPRMASTTQESELANKAYPPTLMSCSCSYAYGAYDGEYLTSSRHLHLWSLGCSG